MSAAHLQQGNDMLIRQCVVDHLTVAAAVDEIAIAEHTELVRDGGAIDSGRGREVTNTELRGAEGEQDTQPCGITQDREERGDIRRWRSSGDPVTRRPDGGRVQAGGSVIERRIISRYRHVHHDAHDTVILGSAQS